MIRTKACTYNAYCAMLARHGIKVGSIEHSPNGLRHRFRTTDGTVIGVVDERLDHSYLNEKVLMGR